MIHEKNLRVSLCVRDWFFGVSSDTESCDEDDEEAGVGVVEELVDKPGTTNGA